MFAHANALTHARTLGRSVARPLGRSVARSLGRSAARDMLALYREAHKKKSDVMALNKIALTQKNCQYEKFKFYKEHLHPLSPIPSLRHMLMWSLQSSMYVVGWQFSFNGQLTMKLSRPLASSASSVAGDRDLGLMMCTQAYHGLMCA